MSEYTAPVEHSTSRSPLMQHRSFLGLYRKQLDDAAMALLEPGEQLIGTFDAVTSHPSVREASFTFVALGVWFPFIGLTNGDVGAWVIPASLFTALGVLGVLFCKLSGSRWVMFAITSQGVVQCGLDLLGRPRSILSRSPAAAPELLQRSLGWRKIALGHTVVWVKHWLGPLLARLRQDSGLPPADRSRTRAVTWWMAVGVLVALASLVALVGAGR